MSVRQWHYSLLGVLLGVAGPIGAFLIRLMLVPSVSAAPVLELRANGLFYLYQLVGTSVVLGVVGFFVGHRAERLEREGKLHHALAEHDDLTGLLNARAFRSRFQRALERAEKHDDYVSILLIDVDHLKEINDTYGHAAGNAALQAVAHVLFASCRRDDMAARWGGDEFVVLMEGAGEEAACRVAGNFLDALRSAPLHFRETSILLAVTVGLACGKGKIAGDDLFDRADRALYEGKVRGGNRLQVSSTGSAGGSMLSFAGHAPLRKGG